MRRSVRVVAAVTALFVAAAGALVARRAWHAARRRAAARPTLAGMITPPEAGAGAQVALDGPVRASAAADGGGGFFFASLPHGRYTVRPGRPGVAFEPAWREVEVTGDGAPRVHFAAAALPATGALRGTLRPAPAGSGAAVALEGPVTAVALADGGGRFAFGALPPGRYTVTPGAPGVRFEPPRRTVEVRAAAGAEPGVADFAGSTDDRLLLWDDFEGPALGEGWLALERAGDYSNRERQCYRPSQVAVSGGELVLTATGEADACGDLTHAPGRFRARSGAVIGRALRFTYGRVEVRARLPGGAGVWPAVWLLGSRCQERFPATADSGGPCRWPEAGSDEIDLAEVLDSNPLAVNQQIHAVGAHPGCRPATPDLTAGYHVFRLDWRPGEAEWFVDGQRTCRVTQAVPSGPMFLILNTALGGQAGAVDRAALPQAFRIDYVKVTQPAGATVSR